MNLLSPIGILLIGLFYMYKKGSCMQKIVLSLLVCCSLSLPAMQTEQERHESTCKEWGKYLIRAAESIQADAAMVHQIAANMKREKCQHEVTGRINRSRFQNLTAFKEAGAALLCYQKMTDTLYCTHNYKKLYCYKTSCEESDPISYCNFRFENK